MATFRSELGKLGEDIACKYLVDKGYGIIERNFRKTWGEIDIIAKAPDKTLVFVEVKTMRDFHGQKLQPEEQLTKAKLQKLQRTASLYAGHYSELIKDDKGWQIDLVALTLRETSGLRLRGVRPEDSAPRDPDSRRSILNGLNGLTLRHNSGSILSESNGLTIEGESCDIRHYENI